MTWALSESLEPGDGVTSPWGQASWRVTDQSGLETEVAAFPTMAVRGTGRLGLALFPHIWPFPQKTPVSSLLPVDG